MNTPQPPKSNINQSQNKSTQSKSTLQHRQQQFILKFCWQLAKVVEACKHSETAEIEIGRRRAGKKQIRVKLLAERDTQLVNANKQSKDKSARINK